MRPVIAIACAVLASACSLYFGEGDDDDIVEPDPDPDPNPDPDPDPTGAAVARCEDGTLYQVNEIGYEQYPPHGSGEVIGRCAAECRSGGVPCENERCDNAPEALCLTPPSRGAVCALEGTACTGTGTARCAQTTRCGFAVPGPVCTCVNGAYACGNNTATVQQRLVGKWRGRVMPPEFTQPYDVSLWIYPDGTYWGDVLGQTYAPAFYYGGDDPHPSRKITILSTSSSVGAYADIGQFSGTPVGQLSALFVTDTTLRFTYHAAWHGCSQPFLFDLARE